jgi:sugar phosphate isomerase/epimerase
MASNGNLRFGVDLITLYDPSFWGMTDFNAFYNNEILSPDVFWDRALDTLAEAGVDGVEITFGPGHWRNALARYGSAEAFQAAVNERGLVVCSGFYTGLVLGGDWRPEERRKVILDEVAEYADFLSSAGCDIMIAGLPMRQSWDDDPPLFVDLAYATDLAGLINQMGYVALKRGVRLAIHPETHAVFWLRRDLDLFMALTDPVYVWFCPDTAHITTGGTNPVDVLRDHHGRVIISHWKDAKGRPPVLYPIDEDIFRSHHPYFARVGSGEVDWVSWVKTLRDVRFRGWAILELDAAPDPPVQLAAAKKFVETTLLPIYS